MLNLYDWQEPEMVVAAIGIVIVLVTIVVIICSVFGDEPSCPDNQVTLYERQCRMVGKTYQCTYEFVGCERR